LVFVGAARRRETKHHSAASSPTGTPVGLAGDFVSCPGSVHGVRAGPERLRAVLFVDVSFARVSVATRVRGEDDDDDAVPALRELSDAEALRLRPTATRSSISLVCQS